MNKHFLKTKKFTETELLWTEFNMIRNVNLFHSNTKLISYSTSLPIYNWELLNFYFSHSNRYKVISHCGFKVHFPNTNHVEPFLYLLVILISSLVKDLFKTFAPPPFFFIYWVVYLLSVCKKSLISRKSFSILDIGNLSNV